MIILRQAIWRTAIRAYSSKSPKNVPSKRDGLDSPTDFLTKLGKGAEGFADKFPNWDALFTYTTTEMKTAGVPVKAVELYRLGVSPEEIPKLIAKNKKTLS